MLSSSLGSVPNPFRYVGAMLDSSTGLYMMEERYYDPSVGRFTQEDPAGGGYSYVDGNPVNYVDPWGLGKSKPHKHKVSKTYKTAKLAKKAAGVPYSEEPIKTGGNNKVEKWWLFKNTKGKLVTVMRHDTDPEHPEIHYHVGQPKIGSTLSPGGRIIYKPIEGEPQANIAMTAVESENGAFLFAADDE